MFNPQNVSPDQLKFAHEQMKNMNEEDFARIGLTTGLGANTEQLKSMHRFLKGMDSQQLQQMSQMAQNMKQVDKEYQEKQKEQVQQSKNTENSSNFKKIDQLRQKGNEYFKQNNYEQAGKNYLDAIFEIEETKICGQYKQMDEDMKQELKELEIKCRSNYSTVKAKQNDFEVVLYHSEQILSIDPENGKGLFRYGQSLFHLQKYNLAFQSLKKAQKILTNDQTVKQLLDEVEKKLEEQNAEQEKQESEELNNKQQEQKQVSQQDAGTKKEEEQKMESQSDSNKNQNDKEKYKPPKKQKIKLDQSAYVPKQEKEKIIQQSQQTKKSESKVQQKEEKKQYTDVIIEEEQIPQQNKGQENQKGNQPKQCFSSVPDVNIEQAKQQQQYLKCMSKEQLEFASNQFKSQDKSLIRQQMKAQNGVELSDFEIEKMQQMMTPEAMQMMANMDMSQLASFEQFSQKMQQQKTSTSNQQQSSQSQSNQSSNNNSSSSQKSSGNITSGKEMEQIMKNPNLMNMAFDQFKKNPEMLKQMSQMLGPNNPMGKYFQNASPEQLEQLISVMPKLQNFAMRIMWLVNFIKKYKHILLILLVVLIAYWIFK